MNNAFGLNEIRLVNSAFFGNEVIKLDDSTLFLGSSGVGKTTVLSAIMFFYSQNKKKTRPDKKDKDFFEWHLNTPSSYVMYKYRNRSGSVLLVVGKDKSRPKFLFADINDVEDIESLYLDEENTVIEFDKLGGRLADKGIYFYTTDKVIDFKRVLHRDEFKRIKNYPTIDFSLFRSIENTEKYSDHLFKIYKNSTVKDSNIKQMLISIIGDSETTLDLYEFDSELKKALSTVEEVEYIKGKRDSILKLDMNIKDYNSYINSTADLKEKIRDIHRNNDEINTYISDNLAKIFEQNNSLKRKLDATKENWDKRKDTLIGDIKKLEYKLDVIKKKKTQYMQTYKIELLLSEESGKEALLSEYEKLNTRVLAMNAEIKDIDNLEKNRKDEVERTLFTKKREEYDHLNTNENKLNELLTSVYTKKDERLKNETVERKKELEKLKVALGDTRVEKATLEGNLSTLTKQEVTSSLLKTIKEKIQDFKEKRISSAEKLNATIKELDSLESQKVHDINEMVRKREDMIEYYGDEIKDANKLIDDISSKLDIGKSNLFGYLNNHEISNKEEILSVVGEDFLFKENLFFTPSNENKNLFGLDISGNYISSIDKYNIETLKDELQKIKFNKSSLVAEQKSKLDGIEKRMQEYYKKNSKDQKAASREKNKLESDISVLDRRINEETIHADSEFAALKESIKEKIANTKKNISNIEAKIFNDEHNIREQETSIERIVYDIEEAMKSEILKLTREKDAVVKDIKTLDDKYNKLKKEKFDLIKKEFEKRKEDKGIDIQELDSLNDSISSLDKRLQNIKNNEIRTSEYINNILPEIKKIPENEHILISLEEKKQNQEQTFNQEIKDILSKIKEYDALISKFQQFEYEYKDFINKTVDLTMHLDHSGDYYTEEEIESLLSSKRYFKYYENYNTTVLEIEKISNTIQKNTRSLCSNINHENMLNLKTVDGMDATISDDVNSYIIVAKDYIRFLKEELDIEGLGLQIKTLSEIVNKAYSTLKHIKSDISTITGEIGKINKMIRDSIENIRVLDMIKLNYYESDTDSIATRIDSLGKKFEKEYYLLFNSNSDNAKIELDRIVNIARELKDILSTNTRKVISVSDLSTLSFDIGENGNEFRGEMVINDIGSNGTSIMIKTILYITLLKRVSEKVSHLEDIKFHCILDEIGQISADYFSELLGYTKLLGFDFLNGTAANDDDIIYEYSRVYTGIREGNNTIMTLTENNSLFDGSALLESENTI